MARRIRAERSTVQRGGAELATTTQFTLDHPCDVAQPSAARLVSHPAAPQQRWEPGVRQLGAPKDANGGIARHWPRPGGSSIPGMEVGGDRGGWIRTKRTMCGRVQGTCTEVQGHKVHGSMPRHEGMPWSGRCADFGGEEYNEIVVRAQLFEAEHMMLGAGTQWTLGAGTQWKGVYRDKELQRGMPLKKRRAHTAFGCAPSPLLLLHPRDSGTFVSL
eukprot:365443-Chlamydomonas_euryale.AAC.26